MKDQMAENVSISRIVDSVTLCVIRKASKADAKLPARHRASANGGGGYLRGEKHLKGYEVCHSVTCWSRSCYHTSYERGLLKLPYEVW